MVRLRCAASPRAARPSWTRPATENSYARIMKPGRHRRDAGSGVSRARTHNKPTRTRTSQVSPARRPFSLHRGAAGRKRSRRPPSLTARGPSPRRDDLPIHSALAEIAVDCRQCVPQRGHQRASAPDRLRRRDATRPTRVRARRLRQGEGRVRRAAPATRSSARYFLNEQCARAGRAKGPSRKSGSRAVRGHSRRAFWPGLVEERSNNRFQERSTANPAPRLRFAGTCHC